VKRVRCCATILAALVLATAPAQAHEVFGIGGVPGGLLHPLLVPSHALTLVALSLLVGQQAPRRAVLVALFAVGMIAGLMVIVSAFALDRTNDTVLAVAAVTGLAVALARPLWPATAVLAATAGIAIELDSVPQEISMLATFLALMATIISAVLAVLVVSALAASARRQWQRVGLRVAGSWIAAIAILTLALRLTR
jgi:urease accessory protein